MCVKILKALVHYIKNCELLIFFLFMKTFQALKTLCLLMRECGEINDIELRSTKTSPPNQEPFPPTPPPDILISRTGFGKRMQIDLMICISRSFLSLMSSDILGQELFLWESGMVSGTEITNVSNNVPFQGTEVNESFPPVRVTRVVRLPGRRGGTPVRRRAARWASWPGRAGGW